MSVTLIALRNITLIRPSKVEKVGLCWYVHFANDRDYNKGLKSERHYDATADKEVNVGNWTYYNNFVEWLIATFPNMKPFEFALQTYAINSDYCNRIFQALDEIKPQIGKYKHMTEFHQTFLDIHAAFEFTGFRGLVIFE